LGLVIHQAAPKLLQSGHLRPAGGLVQRPERKGDLFMARIPLTKHATRHVAFLLASVGAASLGLAQDVRPAQVIARVGDLVPNNPGWTITAVNTPFTDIDGSVGFTGTMANPAAPTPTSVFVWRDSAPVFTGLAAPDVSFQIIEDSLGVGQNGLYFFSPIFRTEASTSGFDSIWSNLAPIEIREGDPAPGLPGLFVQSTSGPTIVGGGIGYMVASVRPASGVANQRVLYRWTPAAGFIPLYRSGQAILPAPDNFPISLGSGLSFRYDAADNAANLIHVIQFDTGQLFNDSYLVVGTPAALTVGLREGAPTNDPQFNDLWSIFSFVSINSSGIWVVGGRTNSNLDGVIAVNGTIALREVASTVDGITLDFPGSVLAVSINNDGLVAHVWQHGSAIIPSPTKTLFIGRATNLLGTSRQVVKIGDQLDTNADGTPDWDVTDLDITGATSAGLDLAEDSFINVTLQISPIGTLAPAKAVVRFAIPTLPGGPSCDYDYNQDENVDLIDAQQMAQVFVGLLTPEANWLDGDLNGDENANLTDAQILAAYVVTGVCEV